MTKKLLKFPSFCDDRGTLTVIEEIVPFPIKRIYYIYNTNNLDRGYHKHINTSQLAITLNGSCKISFSKNNKDEHYNLNSPDQGILILPGEFHWMSDFSDDCILMIIASHEYDKFDYLYTK